MEKCFLRMITKTEFIKEMTIFFKSVYQNRSLIRLTGKQQWGVEYFQLVRKVKA